MFIIYPTGTDAPIYHWPFATGGLIAANIIVFVLQCMFPGAAEFFLLDYGTINPLTWVTSICMHASLGHLLGNMVGIALFGWIIEGKIGWWRFLLVYFAIGVSSCCVENCMMFFFFDGKSLGASGVLFGLIAMAMIWAPENNITLNWVFVFFFYPFWGTFEVTILGFGFVMIGIEYLIAAFSYFTLSSALLHLLGAAPGFAIALLMLKFRRVDCEGFDMLSTWAGKRGQRTLTVEQEEENRKRKNQARQDRQHALRIGLEKVDNYVANGHNEMALKRFSMLHRNHRSLVMTESQLVAIIKAFDADPAKREKSIPVIETYLQHYSTYKIQFTLMLARTLVVGQQRPRRAIMLLKSLSWNELNPVQKSYAKKIASRAQQMIGSGILELQK